MSEALVRTEALAQMAGGMDTTGEGFIKMLAAEIRAGTPGELDLTRKEWVEKVDAGRLRYAISGDSEVRRELAGLLTAPEGEGGEGLSNRQAADVLGVSHQTLGRDIGDGPSGPPDESEPAADTDLAEPSGPDGPSPDPGGANEPPDEKERAPEPEPEEPGGANEPPPDPPSEPKGLASIREDFDALPAQRHRRALALLDKVGHALATVGMEREEIVDAVLRDIDRDSYERRIEDYIRSLQAVQTVLKTRSTLREVN